MRFKEGRNQWNFINSYEEIHKIHQALTAYHQESEPKNVNKILFVLIHEIY